MTRESLEKFGEFFVRNLRDAMKYNLETTLSGSWKAPGVLDLQKRLVKLDDADKQTIRELVDRVITGGMHDFLFALQEESDSNGSIRLLVDGEEIAKESDGLHGELFTEEGWIARYSKYPVVSEE